MNRRVSLMTGLLTALLFAAVGVSLLLEGQRTLGALISGLAALRALWWVRQVRAAD